MVTKTTNNLPDQLTIGPCEATKNIHIATSAIAHTVQIITLVRIIKFLLARQNSDCVVVAERVQTDYTCLVIASCALERQTF